MVTMRAKVLEVCCDYLIVCDLCDCRKVRVNTCRANCFSCGDCVCIHYSGAMALSIPPQISADCIHLIDCH